MIQSIKRVVVSLDTASETTAAIDTAARLAVRWHVPLHGVFIEDEDLIGLAGLPFARQVTLATGREPLTKDHVEEHFRAFAKRSRRELAAAAARQNVAWSFQVMRGPLDTTAIGNEHDFIVAGAASRPIGDHFRIASRWWSVMTIIARPVLLAKRAWETGGSVLALLRRHSALSERTLDIAAQIAGFCDTTLTVAGAPDIPAPDDFAAWVSRFFEGHSLNVHTEPAAMERAALRQRCIELDCRLLVLEGDPEEGRTEKWRELIEPLACDILVVR